ncbi:MAG: hypothetical protein KDI68_04765 [Gammaproteobacteria bacterium]|nr:hypothetical protein [Gammaproteobacteria bacterium]
MDAAVARICDLGCSRVYGTIAELELGRETEETRGLPTAVRRRVLQELKAVMAVYDAREGGPTCKTE